MEDEERKKNETAAVKEEIQKIEQKPEVPKEEPKAVEIAQPQSDPIPVA